MKGVINFHNQRDFIYGRSSYLKCSSTFGNRSFCNVFERIRFIDCRDGTSCSIFYDCRDVDGKGKRDGAAYVTKPVKEKYTVKDALSVFKLRPVVSLFLAMLFITAATNIFNGSLLYYLSYIISNPKLLSAASFLGMLGALAAGLLVPKLSQRYGKNICTLQVWY